MEKNNDAGLPEVRRVFYDLCAAGNTPSVRDVFKIVGGNFNTVTTLVREVNREIAAAPAAGGALPEAAQNAVLAVVSSLVEKREEIIRRLYAQEQKMFEEVLEQLRQVESENYGLKNELARLKVDHDVTVKDLQVKVAALTENGDALERKCAKLEGDKEGLIRDNEACRFKTLKVEADYNRIEGAAQVLEQQFKDKEGLLIDTQRQLADAERRAAAGEARIGEMQSRIEELGNTTKKLEGDLEITREQRIKAERIAAGADARREEMEVRVTQLETLLRKGKDRPQPTGAGNETTARGGTAASPAAS